MSVASASKYRPLTLHLKAQRGDRVAMSFAEIERVLGTKLPNSARAHRAWWSNNPTNNMMTKAWLAAGFQSEQVDIEGRKLVFKRAANAAPSSNFAESAKSDYSAVPKLSLFGWLRGSVVSTGDLTEPADPNWGARVAND